MDPTTWPEQLEKMATFTSVVQILLVPLGMAYLRIPVIVITQIGPS